MKFDIKNGLDSLKESLVYCSRGPGIYQFSDENDNILYIGKAKNIKNRITSYLNFNLLSNRIKKLISLLRTVKFIKTHTEVDALILESNLIKKHKPPYNIRLIDDKTFPFISISKTEIWSRLKKTRKIENKKSFYFGPFANSIAIEKVFIILEKGFLLRTCSDSNFSSRKRPCLLYQIKRCSAPCVGKISSDSYKDLVNQAIDFLEGKDSKIKKELIIEMEKASKNEEYEKAALFRDRIKALSIISQEKYVSLNNNENFDIISMIRKVDLICIQVFFFRSGKNLGNKEYFFENQDEKTEESLMDEFLSIFYFNNQIPNFIYTNIKLKNKRLIELALKKNKKINVNIVNPKKGKKLNLINMVEENISHSINKYSHKMSTNKVLLKLLTKKLELGKVPNRIEVYDNSHLNGSQPVGAMIVYNNDKFERESYRKFNIRVKNDNTYDDYFMMEQVINRRFNLDDEVKNWKYATPDLLIIDGGRGHYNSVKKVLNKKNLNNIDLVSIAKGKNRNAGNEKIFLNEKMLRLDKNDKILFFLQRLRDEAHRFVINSQKVRRKKIMKNSVFDVIPGIGTKVKKNLLSHFGSIDNIKTAGIKDLENTPGIGKLTAKKIYEEFNG